MKNNNNELGIYIHIPFCVHKCIYCDFLSSPADEETKKRYVNAIIKEIYLTKEGRDSKAHTHKLLMDNNDGIGQGSIGQGSIGKKDIVTSIFIGGGTPSVIDALDIKAIIESVRDNYNVSEAAEITIECNPGTLDMTKIEIYREAGINRISFGLQSTSNSELKLLGRIHTYEQFVENYKLARKAGFDNINIDLMSALPGQTIESYRSVLKKAISLETEHISVYSLIIEEGTRLSDNIDRFPPIPSEEDDRYMYHMTKDILAVAGYGQYEISNYARKGYECRHNIKYWERCNYIGFGIGAASLYGEKRYTNISDIRQYMDILLGDEDDVSQNMEYLSQGIEYVSKNIECVSQNIDVEQRIEAIRTDVEKLSREDEMSEYMFLGLRKTAGIDIADFKEKFGCDISKIYDKPIKDNIASGLLVHKGNRLYLSQRGIDISNTVMSDFIL